MIIKTDKLQEICKNIMEAIDSSAINNVITETLELKAKENKLHLSVTNQTYFVTASIEIEQNEEFYAVISANLFLQLISKITTTTIELIIDKNTLIVKGNGDYKFPLIYNGNELLTLPRINIENLTNEFVIPTEILKSILTYNSKELQKTSCIKPVQRLFYIDENGAITFTSGACINTFTLEKPIKLLLPKKIIQLFKLFNSENVNFKIGFNQFSNSINQTVIQFSNNNIELTAIITNEQSLITSVPVNSIRGLASENYPSQIVVNKQAILDAIDRLSIFYKDKIITLYSFLNFENSNLTVYDTKQENFENIELTQYTNDNNYSCILNTIDLKLILDSLKDEFITIKFGNGKAIVIERPNISYILPECKVN